MKKNTHLLLLSLGLLVSACDRVEDVESKYEKKSQIPINARSIAVLQDFNAYSKTPESDQLFSKTLVQGIEKWAKHRLLPVSQDGIAQITVREASIIKLPNASNVEKLEGRLDVIVTIIDKNGVALSSIEAKVRSSKNAPLNMSPDEKRTLIHAVITQVINSLDKEIETAIYDGIILNRDAARTGSVGFPAA